MAQGDVIWFDQARRDLWLGKSSTYDPGNDVWKCAIVDDTLTPESTSNDPRWGAGGGVDFSVNEVPASGDYVSGGNAVENVTVSAAAPVIGISWDDPGQWDSGSGQAKWAIVWNSSDPGGRCICAMDLGEIFDMSTGPLKCEFGTPVLESEATT